jgi:uncharacterized protein YggE
MRLVSVVAVVLVAAWVGAEEPPGSDRRTLSVTGQGEMTVAPDRVEISFAVETTAESAAKAVAENARQSAAVAAALRPVLGPEDTVTTTRYSIDPRYESLAPSERRAPRITGYVVQNAVRVSSRQVDKVGAMIDAASGAGANRVGSLEFSLSRRTEVLRTALEQAGADARAQADSAAKGLGVRIKGVVSATTSSPPIISPRRYQTMEMVAESRAAPTPVEPGQIEVSATLSVTYEIE